MNVFKYTRGSGKLYPREGREILAKRIVNRDLTTCLWNCMFIIQKKAFRMVYTLIALLLCVTTAADDTHSEISIAQLRALKAATGTYRVEGYVAKQYRCPPCPPGDQCKPCMRNNILLSETPESLISYPTSGNYLRVFTDQPELLQKEVRYRMTLRVLTQNSPFGGHDTELINAERL